MSNNSEHRIKRLKYQSWYRGCKETDILLGNFARAQLDALSELEIDAFERLLEENDVDMFRWLTDQAEPPEHIKNDAIFAKIYRFCKERVEHNSHLRQET